MWMLSKPVWSIVVGLILTVLLITTARRQPSSSWRLTHNILSHSDLPLLQNVLNETLGFEKIFVINLPSRTDHKDSTALAAHFTGLHVDYIDGVTNVEDKTLPPHPSDFSVPSGVIGAWRAHMNIARTMVEQNITTALILEDDSDWDLRIKSQMQDFARASRLLLQPSSSDEMRYLDPTNPRKDLNDQTLDFPLSTNGIKEPTTSPYGDIERWDVLWLGHCGTHFPRPDESTIPLGRVTFTDQTVPESQHIRLQFGNDDLAKQYPNHARAVHRVSGNVCTLAYALTLPAARRMLYEFSIHRISSAMDLMLGDMCVGNDGRKMRTCLTVQPQLFQHHRAIGSKASQSDIAPHPDEFNPVAFTRNIRWSTRVNLPKLIDGETDYIDTFPDGAEAVDLGF